MVGGRPNEPNKEHAELWASFNILTQVFQCETEDAAVDPNLTVEGLAQQTTPCWCLSIML